MRHVCQIGTALLVAAMTLGSAQADALFTTSFETSEGYSTTAGTPAGNLIGQVGWTAPFGTVTGMSVVTGGQNGLPAAPAGANYAKILKGLGDTRAAHSINSTTVETDFTLTMYLAFDDTSATANGTAAVVYISDTAGSFNGVIFGLNREGSSGVTKFQYRNNSTWTTVAGSPDPVENTFYKFVVNVHAATAQYDLSIYKLDNTLIGQVTGAAARNGIKKYQYIAPTQLGDSNDLMYFDMPAVPEPASTVLLGAGAVMLLCRRF